MSTIMNTLIKQVEFASNAGKDLDKDISTFIHSFVNSSGPSGADTLESLLTSGYCYYFALVLKEAFPGGYIAWVKPYGHICYMYKDLPYDATGIYMGDGEIVPYEQLGDTLEAFRHRGKDKDLYAEMQAVCKERGYSFDDLCKKIYTLIPTDQRLPIDDNMDADAAIYKDAARFFSKYKDMI